MAAGRCDRDTSVRKHIDARAEQFACRILADSKVRICKKPMLPAAAGVGGHRGRKRIDFFFELFERLSPAVPRINIEH
jgi:hypothetical protein